MNKFITEVIDNIIENEEGGWKLSNDPNDLDGGYTMCGITAPVWEKYATKQQAEELSKELLGGVNDKQKHFVRLIYKQEYIDPLVKADVISAPIVAEDFEEPSSTSGKRGLFQQTAAMLSCAINCGIGTCIKINDASLHGDIQDFVKAWQDYYTNLVANNAQAWLTYANELENNINGISRYTTAELAALKPKSFRAKYLKGWINRTQRYF